MVWGRAASSLPPTWDPIFNRETLFCCVVSFAFGVWVGYRMRPRMPWEEEHATLPYRLREAILGTRDDTTFAYGNFRGVREDLRPSPLGPVKSTPIYYAPSDQKPRASYPRGYPGGGSGYSGAGGSGYSGGSGYGSEGHSGSRYLPTGGGGTGYIGR